MSEDVGSGVHERMREDWNARAREDMGYYVAFGSRESSEAEFFATAGDVIRRLEGELRRVPLVERGDWRALEIGCGPGRLMRPMSRHFVEIHGVDVSDEMIARAREKLAGIGNAHVHATGGASLEEFADESFEFVYSYAVFQHIPSREVVYAYLRETRRVLKTGGLAVLQFTGLAARQSAVSTWDGVRFTSAEVLEFAHANDLQVLSLEGARTQYMWTVWRKRPEGWSAVQESRTETAQVHIRRITNARGSEPGAPCRGRFASISIWVENLPPDAGLQQLKVTVGSSLGTLYFIGPRDSAGLQQVNVILPALEETGLLPVEMLWLGRPVSPPATLRIIPLGPLVPRIDSVRDGINLAAQNRIETGIVKMVVEEIDRPEEIAASIDGYPVLELGLFCTDPGPQRFEVDFRLPPQIGPGEHQLDVRVGRRRLTPVKLHVVTAAC